MGLGDYLSEYIPCMGKKMTLHFFFLQGEILHIGLESSLDIRMLVEVEARTKG